MTLTLISNLKIFQDYYSLLIRNIIKHGVLNFLIRFYLKIVTGLCDGMTVTYKRSIHRGGTILRQLCVPEN